MDATFRARFALRIDELNTGLILPILPVEFFPSTTFLPRHSMLHTGRSIAIDAAHPIQWQKL